MATALQSERRLSSSSRAADPKRSFLVFELGEQAYGIPIEVVEEILPMASLSRPPQAPPLLAGFLNLEGEPVPVIRLRRLFGGEMVPAELYTPLVLVRLADRLVALWVDKVQQIASARDSMIAPVDGMYSLNQCATGVVEAADTVVVLLSPERLLLEQESVQVDELTAMERERLQSLAEAAR